MNATVDNETGWRMRAFILRMVPEGVDWVPEALTGDQISIGWGQAEQLLDPGLDYQAFRDVVKRHYYTGQADYKQAGSTAGMLWLFIREMTQGDLVVVPSGGHQFYVAAVRGEPIYLRDKVAEHTAFRRPVEWLNAKAAIPRRNALAALQSRMKVRQTCADASDLVSEIEDSVRTANSDQAPEFGIDLRRKLIDQAKLEMTSGRMDSYGFEKLVATLLRSLGSTEVQIIGRSEDLGVDIIATFLVADTIPLRLGIQAKHFRPSPPVGVSVIDQLVAGMEAEQIRLGWVATSGSFSPEADARKTKLEEEHGFSIALVDGDELAAMIVEGGLRAVGYAPRTV